MPPSILSTLNSLAAGRLESLDALSSSAIIFSEIAMSVQKVIRNNKKLTLFFVDVLGFGSAACLI